MNDQDLKNLFKQMDHGRPSQLEVKRWKRAVRRELERAPGEWLRLAVACLAGVVIGAAIFKPSHSEEKVDPNATIERVHVNLE